MSILVSNIKLALDDSEDVAIKRAISKLRIDKSLIKDTYIFKKSLDARKRNNICFVVSVVIDLFEKEAEIVKTISDPFVMYKDNQSKPIIYGNKPQHEPVVIIGFGPAGIFAAKTLIDNGYDVIVFERGDSVENRVNKINQFWENGKLDCESNVQFGEGGAGTFSDGKLTTRISDYRCREVLSTFAEFGAPTQIMKTAKPHIGTDVLRTVISNIRKDLISKGAEIYFNKRVQTINVQDNKIKSVVVDGQQINASNVILAIGHSARDTFQMILENGVAIENKPFSVGVRIEHLQSKINDSLYGELSTNKNIPQGEYQLSHKMKNDAVYTFCMCPGGLVVPSSSSENTVVTNGMSEYARNQKNANSALVVSVDQNDYGTNILDGVRFQQRLETLAFEHGGKNYKAPAMTVGNFLNHKKGADIKSVIPSYSLGVADCSFDEILPQKVCNMMRLGLSQFNRKIKGFAADDAVMTGVETRTSSPIRILRNDDCQSISVNGLYPCGEGAGYAGGIMSAAVDGIKVAQSIMSEYKPN